LLKDKPGFLCDRISGREWLQVGGLSLLGLNLPTLLQAEAAPHLQARSPEGKTVRRRAKSCIMLFLAGGPSQLDMWDMKPSAPAEIRGEFKPIRTTVPGIQLSEHLPRLARSAHRFTLIRSAHHRVGIAHCAAVYAQI